MQNCKGGMFSLSDNNFSGEQQQNSWLCWTNTTGWQREGRLYIISAFWERYRDYERSQAAKLAENNAVDCSLTHQDRKEAVTDPPPPPHPHPASHKKPPHHFARPVAISLLNTSSLIQATQVYLSWGLTGCTDRCVFGEAAF